jgi:hypothetical protein
VSARSVKLLERISNLEEPESRDTWWSEIRMEIRSHARALNCNAVLGYTETTSIWYLFCQKLREKIVKRFFSEDVCVLSASGTAAVIGFQYTGEMGDSIGGLPIIPKHCKDILSSSLDRNEFDKERLLQKDAVIWSSFCCLSVKQCSFCRKTKFCWKVQNMKLHPATLTVPVQYVTCHTTPITYQSERLS